ncbi:MAG: 50S ribosomal protein L37e [Candidatus Nanoarchaeia archaeon]
MGTGTPSMGRKSGKRRLVTRCRRCGKRSYHVRHKKCSSCGFGRSAKLRGYNWQKPNKKYIKKRAK